MSKASRDKGRRGQTAAANLLKDRDWIIVPVTAGVKCEDIVGTDGMGRQWSIEVKNCVNITQAHVAQAKEQAKARRLPWMLMSKIAGTSSWLIQQQGMRPSIWHEKESLL